MKVVFLFFVLFAAFEVRTFAQTRHTDNTVRLDEGKTGGPASIADISWLAGSWSGTGLGGFSEELWSRPSGGIMMGTYRLIKDGKPVFYEMMLLLETEGTILLRLKHFAPNFVGWEEKDKSVDFKFVKKDGNRMYFSGLTFERKSKTELNIFLALRQKDGSIKEEIFTMKSSDR